MSIVPNDHLFLRTIEAIYDAAPDPMRWPVALQAIADVFQDVGALLLWHRDDGSFGTIVSEGLTAAQSDYETHGWSDRDIRAVRAFERGYFFSGEPFTDRHLCSTQEVRDHPCYTEFLAKHGLGWVASIAVSPDPNVAVILCVQRNYRTKPPYSDDELNSLALIGRHFEKSLRLSIRLLNAELVNVGYAEAFARIGIGVLALDSQGRLLFSNPAAQRFLGDGLTIVGHRLHFGDRTVHGRVDASLKRVLRGDQDNVLIDAKPILIPRHNAANPLVMYLLPVKNSLDLVDNFLTGVRAFLLVLQSKANEPADPAIVRDVLGLTMGEARVAALVGAGLSPRDAAMRLNIAEDTARNVLKRVFNKVGVSRQSELAALVTKLVF